MRILVRLAQAIAGLVVGLALAEGAFWWRDDGAFPHVAVYVPDAALGARLQPHARQRIAFGGNPTTTFTTNDRGYRGADWPPPSPDTVLVVGDSQVFGLGVEDDQTLAARLAERLGRPVLNGGVPTYGPDEYLDVVGEIAAERPLRTVVLVLNFGNDLFEIGRPNRERHAIWDGWAVRAETAPASTTWFPGRAWLYGRSHAFFALRKLLHTPRPEEDAGFASEGTVQDVVRTSADRAGAHARAEERVGRERDAAADAYEAALGTLGDTTTLVAVYDEVMDAVGSDEALYLRAAVEGASVGDIVGVRYAESSRRVTVTAEILEEGARIRRDLRQRMRRLAAETDETWLRDLLVRTLAKTESSLDPALARETLAVAPLPTPFDGVLDRFAALAATHGFEPVVVALPLDVMVLPSQLAKYGEAPADLSGTHVLLDELAEAARARRMRVAAPLPALREAGDPAFLKADLHLSALGQDTVAAVVADAIRGPAPLPLPGPGLPEGRSRIPWTPEWAAAREIDVRRSTANRCQTRQIREWYRMDCWGGDVRGIGIVDAPPEAFAAYDGHRALLLTPVLPGRPVEVDVHWADRTERFAIRWTGDRPTFAFSGRTGPAAPPDGRILAGVQPDILAQDGTLLLYEPRWLGAGAGCADVDCAMGTRKSFPTCGEGQANAGSAGHCFALCADDVPCDAGQCTPWLGSAVCL